MMANTVQIILGELYSDICMFALRIPICRLLSVRVGADAPHVEHKSTTMLVHKVKIIIINLFGKFH